MELNFTKQGDIYVAEFEASGDFNLHIERDGDGTMRVKQRTTSSGEFDRVGGLHINYFDPVIDVDFTALVYPKYIRVESFSMPTMAVVTFA